MYKFKLVNTSKKSIIQYSDFLTKIYPNTNKFTYEFLKWQYIENPDGKVVGYDAFFENELAAHYATIPVKVFINGKLQQGLLSLNTATHKNHRGKRLFTKLAEMTYDFAEKNNYKFIYGVANANSVRGFTKYLGFISKPLITKIGFGKFSGTLKIDNYSFLKEWNNENLNWRVSNPEINYNINNCEISYSPKFGLKAILANLRNKPKISKTFTSSKLHFFNIYIGLDPKINWKKYIYFTIPKKFKSSPLIFIFKSLNLETIDLNNVKFEVIDFDGY